MRFFFWISQNHRKNEETNETEEKISIFMIRYVIEFRWEIEAFQWFFSISPHFYIMHQPTSRHHIQISCYRFDICLINDKFYVFTKNLNMKRANDVIYEIWHFLRVLKVGHSFLSYTFYQIHPIFITIVDVCYFISRWQSFFPREKLPFFIHSTFVSKEL